MSEKQEIYELIRDSGILCNDCGPHGPTYCAEALAELLTQNGYGKAVDLKPLRPRGFRAWLSWLAFKFRTRRVLNMCKRLNIDEMHEHRDDAIHEALKLGMSQKTRQVKSYYAQVEGFLTLDHDTGEMRPTCQSDLRDQCVHQLADALIKSGAVCFTFAEEAGPTVMHLPRLRCAAKLDVVMPDKEEVQPNA